MAKVKNEEILEENLEIKPKVVTVKKLEKKDNSGTDLSCMDLSGLDLSFHKFFKANLCGTNLKDCKVLGANFFGALYDDNTVFPNFGFDPDYEKMVKN